jgi:hypothetical protein
LPPKEKEKRTMKDELDTIVITVATHTDGTQSTKCEATLDKVGSLDMLLVMVYEMIRADAETPSDGVIIYMTKDKANISVFPNGRLTGSSIAVLEKSTAMFLSCEPTKQDTHSPETSRHSNSKVH